MECQTTRFRGETFVNGGSDPDDFDLQRLLPMMNRRGLQLSHIEGEKLGVMIAAVEMLGSGNLEGRFISILFSIEDAFGRRWEDWVDFITDGMACNCLKTSMSMGRVEGGL